MRSLTVLLPTALLAVGLTACSATPSPDPSATSAESVATACAAVEGAVQDAVADFQQIDPADPQAAAAALGALATDVGTAAADVANDEIAVILPRLQSGLEDAATLMREIADGDLGKVAELQGPAREVQDAFEEFATLCGDQPTD